MFFRRKPPNTIRWVGFILMMMRIWWSCATNACWCTRSCRGVALVKRTFCPDVWLGHSRWTVSRNDGQSSSMLHVLSLRTVGSSGWTISTTTTATTTTTQACVEVGATCCPCPWMNLFSIPKPHLEKRVMHGLLALGASACDCPPIWKSLGWMVTGRLWDEDVP